ncbi:Lon protease family protein, partial [Vibrio sp. 10N.222.55.E8]
HLNQSSTLPLTYNIKLIVVGDRAQLGDLDYLDSDIQTGFCLFSEIEQDIKLSHDTLPQYLGYLKWLQQRYKLPKITQQALTAILTAGARETEDQSYIPLCPIWHNALLSEALVEADNGDIDIEHIQLAQQHKYNRESY